MGDNGRIARVLMDWCARRQRGESPRPEDVLPDDADPDDALPSRLAALDALENAFVESAELPEGPPERIGEYRIVREIGRGGMGVVYEAEQSSLNRRVALKLLLPMFTGSPHAVERFQREGQAAALLHHTNVVPIYDMGRHDGYWYYTMELVEGAPLARWIDDLRGAGVEVGASHFRRVAEMFAGVADALESSHTTGIIHRDVKPGNLMLAADGTLKVLDFGVARLDEAPSMTLSGELVGTPTYMSPEQARARSADIDHRTDVYSLGATLYEAITLEPPFKGNTAIEVRSQILERDPRRPRQANRQIPKDLETIVVKAMEKDRRYRYATADEMKRDLLRFIDGVPVRARPVGPVVRSWRHAKRHKIRTSLTAAILMLAVIGGYFAVHSMQEAERRRVVEYEQLVARGQELIAYSPTHAPEPESEPGLVPGETAREVFGQAIALLPERPEAYWLRALASGRTTAERLADIDEAAERGLPERTVKLLKGYVLSWREPENAAAARAAALSIEAVTAVDHYAKARVLSAAGNYPEALEHLDRAVNISSPGETVRFLAIRQRALRRERAGKLEEALQDLMVIRSRGDERPKVGVRIASLWKRLGRQSSAESQFRSILERSRVAATEKAWRALCRACDASGEDDWLDRASAEALEAHPESYHALVYRSVALMVAGKLDKALSLCDRARAAATDKHRGAEPLIRARVLQRMKDYEGACEALTRAISEMPSVVELYKLRGRLLTLHLAKHQEAIEDFTRATELMPLEGHYFCVRARTWQRLDRHDEAISDFRHAIALGHDASLTHCLLADSLKALKKHEEARTAYETAIAKEPKHTRARNKLGCLLTDRLGEHEEALAQFNAVLEKEPDDALVLMNRGKVLSKLGRPEEARAAYETALAVLEKEPDDAVAWTNRGKVLSKLGRLEEARAAYETALDKDPTHVTAHVNLGCLLANRLGDCAAALEHFDAAIKQKPGHATAWANRGIVLKALKPDEALAAFEKAFELGESTANSYSQYGEALLASGRHDKAIKACRKALEIDPTHCGSFITLGMILWRQGKTIQAIEACEEGLQHHPDSLNLLQNKGAFLLKLKHWKQAVVALRAAIDAHPERVEPYRAIAEAYRALEEFERELAAWGKVVKISPDDAGAHFQRGWLLKKLKRHEEALDAYAEARKLEPEEKMAWNNRANLLTETGRPEEALRELNEGLQKHPYSASMYYNKGHALRKLKRFEEALAAHDAGIRLAPTWSLPLIGKARVLDVELGRHKEALIWYRKAAKLDADNAGLWWAIFTVLHRLNRTEEALYALDRLERLTPDDKNIHFNRGLLLHGLDRFEEALKAFRRALEIDGKDPVTLFYVGLMAARLEKFETAAEAYRRAAELDTTGEVRPRALGNRGRALYELFRYVEARDELKRALKLAPGIWNNWSMLSPVQFELQEFEAALAALAKAQTLNPKNLRYRAKRAYYLAHLGRAAEARRVLEELDYESESSGTFALWYRMATLELLGRFREAMEAARVLYEKDTDHRTLGDLEYGLHRVRCLRGLGETDAAREIAVKVAGSVKECERDQRLELAYLCAVAGDRKRAESLLDAWDYPWQPNDLYERARVHAVLGDKKAALHWLERAAEKGLRRSAKLPPDREFKSLEDDSTYKTLRQQMDQ